MNLYRSRSLKKSNTILSPHLEILANGTMMIELENMLTAHRIGDPLNGCLKINLKDEFKALNITLNLIGFCRSHLAVSSKYGDNTRLAKTLIDIEYTLANFEGGQTHQGMYEYPFSINLPPEFAQSVMV